MKHTLRSLELLARDALVSALVAGLALGPAATPAWAGPRNPDVRRGNVTIDETTPGRWIIHASDGSIIQYSSFDIAAAEAVQFIQPGADARVLNRILGDAPTRIDGSLSGNGHIYIVNPAGVFFGPGARVNVNGLHAAAGRISDDDFIDKNDHFTDVRGKVTNQGLVAGCDYDGTQCVAHELDAEQVAARAVSLVGAQVVNDAGGRILAQGGWIVIAAGNDVLIGRDDSGRGLLLRIEGAANAVFDRSAAGVTNHGVLDAGLGATGGKVSIGAGDLYGTAIFSDNAIRAREIALDAANRGDVALGGTVQSEKLDVTMRGLTPGQIQGATAGTTTVNTDALNLVATDTGAALTVGSGLRFRSQASDTTGPASVTVAQSAAITTSKLSNLDIAPSAATTLKLASSGGNVIVDDRRLVNGTQLATDAAQTEVRGTQTLNVASLAVKGKARSEADIVAATGGISVTSDLDLVTKAGSATDPTLATLLSAHGGGLGVDGNITMTDGGSLRIEAQSVRVGKVQDDIASGGTIKAGGAVRGGVAIGFTDATGAQQTQSVKASVIDTRGATGVAGGDVDVRATGNVEIGTIGSAGGTNVDTTRPNFDGGNVRVVAGDTSTLKVTDVVTGGAEAAGAAEIALSAGTVVLAGALDATGGTVRNPGGRRDRNVGVSGALSLDADSVALLGGDVTVSGPVTEATPTGGAQREVDFGIQSAGTTRLGDVDVKSLEISSQGNAVVFTGDVHADTTVAIGFDIDGTATIRGEPAGGGSATVEAKKIAIAAIETDDPNGRSAELTLGDGVEFLLSPTTGDSPAPATMLFTQDKSLTGDRVTSLMSHVSVADGSPLKLELRSNDVVSLDQTARDAVSATDLLVEGRRFEALGATGAATDWTVRSLALTTHQDLDVNFGVTAKDVSLHSGSTGTGDLLVRSTIDAETLDLVAGDGIGGAGTAARVVIDPAARLRSARTTSVDLIQDASIDSALLPDLAVFGGSVANLGYGLESRDGSVVLTAGSQGKFGGSALRLSGQTGVDLGAEPLSLASLDASTPEALVTRARIDAAPGGTIRLRSGSDGTGDLSVGARLAADSIELVAGSGDGIASTARVLIGDGASFSASGSDAHPLSFVLDQDAALGPVTGGAASTALPGLDLFGGDITGMKYALRSRGSSVTVTDSSFVNGTDLELYGTKGVVVKQDLDVAGLKLTGAATLSGDVISSGGISVVGGVTLDGVGTQRLQAGSGDAGVLKAAAGIVKTTNGAIELSGQTIDVVGVSTAHRGDGIVITGAGNVKTGALDASGSVLSQGGSVAVTSTGGAVDVASIDTRGSNGSSSPSSPSAGLAGGNVVVSGTTVAIGNVTTRGGNATTLSTGGVARAANGGDAGSVAIASTAATDGVTLRGSIDARGGAGSSTQPSTLPPVDGLAADVTVTGDVRLAGSSIAVRGDDVRFTGGVSPSSDRIPSTAPGTTSFTVAGQHSVSFGGDLSATRIDISVADGNLDLASGGVSRISADSIRLAATDGAGGDTQSEVVLDGLTFANEPRTGTSTTAIPFTFTLEQDRSIGTGGTALPDDPLFGGVTSTDRGLQLISYDGNITLDTAQQIAQVTGSDLLLAANGLAGETGPAIRVSGGDLNLSSLALGHGPEQGAVVGGNASVDGSITVAKGLRTYGNLDAAGDVTVGGSITFVGEGDQRLHVDAGHALTINGSTASKSTTGALHLDADRINLSATALTQTIENSGGLLEIGSANGDGLVKGVFDADGNPVPQVGTSSLTLRGTAAPGGGPAVVVHGTRETPGVGDYAVLIADGDLTVETRVTPDSAGKVSGIGTWSVEGDILAYGDVNLNGSGVLAAGRDSYTIEARRRIVARTDADRGGEIHITGLSAADGDLRLKAAGAQPPSDGSNPYPGAIFTSGSFQTAHGLAFAGTTEIEGNTSIRAGGDVSFQGRVQGGSALDVKTDGQLELRSDVVMTAGLKAGADRGVQLTSTSGVQTIQATSINFGNGATAPKKPQASLYRDGDLTLDATHGDLTMSRGQTLVVAGTLDATASGTVALANVAAQRIDARGGDVAVIGGSTLAANRISLSDAPSVWGGGTAFFATPSGTEISRGVVGKNLVLRQIDDQGGRLTLASLQTGEFPTVDGPSRIDFALETPRPPRVASIVRPRSERHDVALARDARPLWADELLVYLEERSLVAATPQEEAALPPVSAGPSDARAEIGGVPLGEEALQVLPAYRELFRPTTQIDPETGLIVGGTRVAEIRASFQQAASAGGELGSAIEADPEARANRAQLAALFAASARALDAQQNARFRLIVLARVAPPGVSARQLDAIVP